MKIDETTFPHIVKVLQNVTCSITEIDEICKIENCCETCIFKVQEKGDWYYRCMQDELVTIMNSLATNPEYQEYLKQHNKPNKEKNHEN